MRPLLLLATLLSLATACGAAGSKDDRSAEDDLTSPDATCRTSAECAVAEQRASDRLDAVRNDPSGVAAFTRRMPKGGDLHHHLSGAVYAETYLSWATAEGGYCIGADDHATKSCGPATAPIPDPNNPLRAQIVSAWSMDGFAPSASTSGRDHFFSTFGRFSALSDARHHGKALADVMQRADDENESYIELMLFSNATARGAGESVWSAAHGGAPMSSGDFSAFRDLLLASPQWPAAVGAIVTDVRSAETEARGLLGCERDPLPGPCRVDTRYQVYISRGGKAPAVFAQMVAAFEAAEQDDRIVALNLVGPEDDVAALSAYDIEMAMLDYLHGVYAGRSPLRISLHAGELTARGLPAGYALSELDHIRKAVRDGHAERIGHGADVMFESDPEGLLLDLKARNVLVEVCLTSNAQILDLAGTAHPLATYLAAGVPVALATDDQGVSRSSIAGELTRAVLDQQLTYRQLKTLARNSLEYSFLSGPSLWTSVSPPLQVPVCASLPDGDAPSSECATFLTTSARASAQWELERRFRVFESTLSSAQRGAGTRY